MPSLPSSSAGGAGVSPPAVGGRSVGDKENLDPLTGLLPRKEGKTKRKGKQRASGKKPAEGRVALAAKPSAPLKPSKAGKSGKRKPAAKRPLALAPAPSHLPSFEFSFDPLDPRPSTLSPLPLPPSWPATDIARLLLTSPFLPEDISEQYDRLARGLTVLPLADVSEAYGVQMEVDPAQIPLPPSPVQERLHAPFSTAEPALGRGSGSPTPQPARKRARVQEPGRRRLPLRRALTDCSPGSGRLQQRPQHPPREQEERPYSSELQQHAEHEQPLETCVEEMDQRLPIWEEL
ncbi:hypothetical protein CALVIDRAFT_528935 [Calocera viscosa TUFC12733]|uniref:Uncharacterized protein n=1 Tax=Calocera viscosa (strain TUFC12733) TaxID=1330018 RepID=A0A167K1P1_CALVF|nr:hypothetical protein CALVIDRAFT_528935 [Calocera viscosa TUFC12733]